jgi:hypothetical protein
MIPHRFVTEYPERCLQLLDEMEPLARDRDLLGSFALMMAASILVIPWERLSKHHPIAGERGSDLQRALKRTKKQRWHRAEFWEGNDPGHWTFSRIMGEPNFVDRWCDEAGQPSMSEAANTINRRDVDDVFRVIRNALAHGNVVYLDKDGRETVGNPLHFIAFLSRYEEANAPEGQPQTYRLVATTADSFLSLIRAWAVWLQQFPAEYDLRVAA